MYKTCLIFELNEFNFYKQYFIIIQLENYRHQEYHNSFIKKQHQKMYKDFLDEQIHYRYNKVPSPSNSADKNQNINNNPSGGRIKNNNNNLDNSFSDRIFVYSK